MERPLSTGEVARRLGVSAPTVKQWIRRGALAAFRTPGGHYRVPPDALEGFVRDARRTPWPAPTGHASILIVDDDPRFLDVVTQMLRHADGAFKVETAIDGYEALLRIGLSRPDLLILDLRMPGLDGLAVCQRLRADPVLRDMAILAVTGFGGPDTGAEAARAGADDLLEKPFSLATFTDRVRRLLGRAVPPAP